MVTVGSAENDAQEEKEAMQYPGCLSATAEPLITWPLEEFDSVASNPR